MDKLPNELMVKILKNLNDFDLDNSVEVCDYWKDLIYDGIGVTRFIGQNSIAGLQIVPLRKFIESEEIGEIGMHYCFVGDIPDQQELPSFRSAYLIKKLSFTGSIGGDNYNKLVIPLENLTCLSFQLTTLENFTFSAELEFPKLKQFKLFGSVSLVSSPKDENVWTNLLMIFLNTHFPQLRLIQLKEIPLTSPNGGQMLLDSLIVFLDKHKATLKKLAILTYMFDRLIEVGKTTPVIPEVQEMNQLQLESFDVYYDNSQGQLVQQKLNEILKTQTSLKAYLGRIPRFDPIFIQQNSSLVTIHLITMYIPNLVIDCQAFENCTALKCLILAGSLGSKCGFINTICLPPSLESICLSRFEINSKNVSDLMTKKWTNSLKLLELHNIRTLEAFGVPFDALCALLKQKSIERVSIRFGMNKKSMEDANKLSLTERARLPQLARRILKLSEYDEIEFALDNDKNYLFMDWDQIKQSFYITHDSNQFHDVKDVLVNIDKIPF